MKRYILIILSVLFIFMSSDIYAQRRNPAKNADLAFGRKQYTEAADRYKKAYRKVRRNKDERNRISFQMAECYRLIGLTKRAEPYYKRLLKTEYPNTHPENWEPGVLDEKLLPEGWTLAYDLSTPTCRLLNQPYDPADAEGTQYYVIDGLILSPNVKLGSAETVDAGFENSDHNPVKIAVTLEK